MINEIVIWHDNLVTSNGPVHMFTCNLMHTDQTSVTIQYPVQMTNTSSKDISYFYLLVLLKILIDYFPTQQSADLCIKMHNFHACNIARDYIYKWKTNQWYDSKGVLNPYSKLLNQLWVLFQTHKNTVIKYPGGRSKT